MGSSWRVSQKKANKIGTKCYDKHFKEQAVQLSHDRGSVNAVAKELGISGSQLTKWRNDHKTYGDKSFLGRGVERLTDQECQIKELKKQLKDKELDLEILKKAIAVFSRADQ